jgi:hypothetical protein
MNSATAPFTVKAGANYTSAEKYMNGTLGIQSMSVTMPTGTFENHARFQIAYERIGQGFMGKSINKTIAIKFQNDASGRFQSCYAVETGTNQDLVKNFCNNLGTSDGNAATVDSIFEWDPATNSCKLKNLRCPIGQIYTGFDSTGVRRCHTIQQWSNLGNFIDTAAWATCAPGNAPNVRFVFSTGARMRVDCGASATPPPTTCTSNAQCPTLHYCNAALGCQPIIVCTPTNGTYTYSAWSACTSGAQTRTVTGCSATCGGTCGTANTFQTCSCPNVMATSPVSHWCYREIGGKCGSRNNIRDCQVGSCGVSNGTGCTIPTRTADPWAVWMSEMPCANYGLGSMPSCTSMGL